MSEYEYKTPEIVLKYRNLHNYLCERADKVVDGAGGIVSGDSNHFPGEATCLGFKDGTHYQTYWFGACGIALSMGNVDLETGYYYDGLPDSIVVEGVITIPGYERDGFGSLAMSLLCDAASVSGVDLVLLAKPIPKSKVTISMASGPSKKYLTKWYRRFGFTPVGHIGWMRRNAERYASVESGNNK